MNNLLKAIEKKKVLVSDGAMGSLLFESGLKQGDCPEALNLSNQGLLKAIASQYLQAGADIIQTNTFGASPLKLSDYMLDSKTEEINRSAVEAVRSVCKGRAFISGSCGPSGKILKPYGDTEPEMVYDSFKRQAKALINAGADIICIETMIDIEEARLAVHAVRAYSEHIPIIASMTFNKTPRGFYTIMGVTIKHACSELGKAGADIIGSNCGNGLEMMIEIAKEFITGTDLPVIIQSNAGLPRYAEGRIIYNESPEFFGDRAGMLVKLGVSIIGGCCGTNPEHIRAIRKCVDSLL